MTKYMFFIEMQDLCTRASQALKVVSKNPLLSDFYKSAAQGYFRRAEALSAGEAEKKISSELFNRKRDFTKWVESQEIKASKRF
ncbi:MAG: hypothetical protein J6S67_03305 [Methanobrevibacter sp.]|nr:hypothetical protein [Methanobrevibacter sp.]